VIGGALYSKQKMLPPLPIPSLEETATKFLATSLPLAKTEAEARSLIEAAKIFPSEAAELQKRLKNRKDSVKDSSWLQHWWNTFGYLQIRDPNVVNISYFFQLDDDDTLPSEDCNKSLGVMRGAAVLHAIADYRKLVCSGSLQNESIRKEKKDQIPLCSTTFKYMFHGCRVPRRNQDTFHIYDPSLYKHCIVAYRGQFFSMDFVDDCNDPFPVVMLERGLEHCIKLARELENDTKLGVLTTSDRDSWADAREELLRVGGVQMEIALEKLESGAILLCLDDEAPVSMRQCANIYWHGGGKSGENRWHDKSIQILCQTNGKVGFLGEHSMSDGMPAVGLCSHILRTKYQHLLQIEHTFGANVMPPIQNVFEGIAPSVLSNPSILDLVEKARADFSKLVSNQQLSVQSFHGYGSNFIKESGYSPDAFIQIIIQLAVYRLFGKQVATYESSQVRIFLHGRTETIRSVSNASHSFVKSMGLRPKLDYNDPIKRKENVSLFRTATESHSKYARDAAQGYGIDRHLYGLSMLVGDGEQSPTLFGHPLYGQSKYWKVSTSTLPNAPGFGCVVPDGVGIAYEVKPDSCIFTITARGDNGWTENLSYLVEEALLEMRLVVDLEKEKLSKL